MVKRKPTRKILIILSNRLDFFARKRYFELEANAEGDVVQEKPLRGEPREARFDEVWENDEGRTAFSSCASFKRKYRHPLERKGA